MKPFVHINSVALSALTKKWPVLMLAIRLAASEMDHSIGEKKDQL